MKWNLKDFFERIRNTKCIQYIEALSFFKLVGSIPRSVVTYSVHPTNERYENIIKFEMVL
jgi:hypothetical protein